MILSDEWEEGYDARGRGETRSDNPYHFLVHPLKHRHWLDGWNERDWMLRSH